MMSNNIYRKTWVEVSRSALLHNFSVFSKVLGESKIFYVLKANAYGHGLEEVAKIFKKNEVEFFAVDNLEEGLLIKSLNIKKPILILGYTPLHNLKKVIKNGFSFTVYSTISLKRIIKDGLNKKAKIHLKVETGLNRQGVNKNELTEIVKYIKKYKKHFILEGISTHFANIEDTLDPSYYQFQLKNFKKLILVAEKLGLRPKYRHCACSAAVILYPETYFDAVRIGISLYGLWPSKETKLAYSLKHRSGFKLEPALTWKSIIAQTKNIKRGESVSYGRTWIASKNSKIAVIPVGYSDGYDRGLSNIGRVIIKNCYAPVIGRVAMNMIMIDVSDIKNIKIEDEVVLLGKSGDKEITAEEIAQKIGTINYEVVSRINPKIKRVVIK